MLCLRSLCGLGSPRGFERNKGSRPLGATGKRRILGKIAVMSAFTFHVRPLSHPAGAPDGAWLCYNALQQLAITPHCASPDAALYARRTASDYRV